MSRTADATETERRTRNRATVSAYMNCRGEARRRRHLLFTEDGVGGLWTTETGEPITISGRDRLRDHADWSLRCFPDWAWLGPRIFDTQSPDEFWVECRGEGTIRFPGYPEGHYTNTFLHYFLFQGDKIKLQREFMNPCQQFRALGIPVPTIERVGIPT